MKRTRRTRLHVLTQEGEAMFPRLKDKVFEVQHHNLAPQYCRARVLGRKTWSKYWSGFFKRRRVAK